jgi:hypothetical protein
LAIAALLALSLAAGARTAFTVDEESWDETHPGPSKDKSPPPAPASPKATAPRATPPAAPTPKPTPDPAKELEKAKELLKQTPEGAAIIKFIEDKAIPIKIDPSDGSFHNKGTVTLGPPFDAEEMALTIAHEANHAKYFKEGRNADITKDTRDDYVRKKIEEEVVGTVASIEVKNSLVKKGVAIAATFPLEKEYNDAYKKAVEDLKKSKPDATEAELDAAGKKAGYEAVKKGFETGKVVASVKQCSSSGATCTTAAECPSGESCVKNSYPVYYGNTWDRAHPKPTPSPAPSP